MNDHQRILDAIDEVLGRGEFMSIVEAGPEGTLLGQVSGDGDASICIEILHNAYQNPSFHFSRIQREQFRSRGWKAAGKEFWTRIWPDASTPEARAQIASEALDLLHQVSGAAGEIEIEVVPHIFEPTPAELLAEAQNQPEFQGDGIITILGSDPKGTCLGQFVVADDAEICAQVIYNAYRQPGFHLSEEHHEELHSRGWALEGRNEFWTRIWPDASTPEARSEITAEVIGFLRELYGTKIKIEFVFHVPDPPGAGELYHRMLASVKSDSLGWTVLWVVVAFLLLVGMQLL
ncbi:MAG: hypothetical protein SX243_05375 [Acidobacteriota bacterium]|nr:hypothetical protein [Acidobacteriota bacterium]